jgi:glycosyltransferase involved in cell wall biosynthesis
MQKAYGAHDALLFTSLRESLGGQVVEAAAAALPIVGLDLHGLASLVPASAAEKVALNGDVPVALSKAVNRIFEPRRYASMSAAAVEFARSLTWSRRAAEVTSVYRDEVLNRFGRCGS